MTKKKTASGLCDDDLIEDALKWLNEEISFKEFGEKYTMMDLKMALRQLIAKKESK